MELAEFILRNCIETPDFLAQIRPKLLDECERWLIGISKELCSSWQGFVAAYDEEASPSRLASELIAAHVRRLA